MDANRQIKANLLMDKVEAEAALKTAVLSAKTAFQNILTEGYVINGAYPEDEIEGVNMDAMRTHWMAFEQWMTEAKRLRARVRDLKGRLGE